MEERIRAIEEIQRTSFEAMKSTLRVLNGLQASAEASHRALGYLARALDLLNGDERPAVKELSAQARAEIEELERLARLPDAPAAGDDQQ